MTERKAKPILFSGPMVLAILAGQKTQTRRVVKPQPGNDNRIPWPGRKGVVINIRDERVSGLSPYGQPGDLLWCRETFSGPHCMEATSDLPALPPSRWPADCPIHYWADGNPFYGDWTRPRPSIHMPRHASRLTLEITDVRVERLQEISEEDTRAEGMQACRDDWSRHGDFDETLTDRDLFEILWEHINGADSWTANPFVWVIQFRAHQMNVDRFLEVQHGR